MEDEEKLSDDPKEQMRLEIELMRLKLQAQFGDALQMETNTELPLEVEHQFLKQIISYEDDLVSSDAEILQQRLGNPEVKNSADLSDEEVSAELIEIEALMALHGVYLERIHGPYPDRIMYDFITKELFLQPIQGKASRLNTLTMDMPQPGESNAEKSGDVTESDPERMDYYDMNNDNVKSDDNDNIDEDFDEDLDEDDEEFDEDDEEFDEEDEESDEESEEDFPINFKPGWHFIYEEYHPNHFEEIKQKSKTFLEDWKNREIEGLGNRLAETLTYPPSNSIKKEKLLEKLNFFFDAYELFENFSCEISEVNYSLQPEGNYLGHCEGIVSYEAVIENGERIPYTGNFKLYYEYTDEDWIIFNFIIPGFEWNF